jgi:hypothetical protein
MPVATLNNATTQDVYTDALTVQFSFARKAFSLNVATASIMYQVGVTSPTGRDISWEAMEHRLDMSFNRFSDPSSEGFPDGSLFAGVRVRSAIAGQPGNVTVI